MSLRAMSSSRKLWGNAMAKSLLSLSFAAFFTYHTNVRFRYTPSFFDFLFFFTNFLKNFVKGENLQKETSHIQYL